MTQPRRGAGERESRARPGSPSRRAVDCRTHPVYTYLAPVRWGDLDVQGHVNNVAYLDYLQDARIDFLFRGPPGLDQLLGTGVLVVSHQVEYLAPLTRADVSVAVALWIDALGGSRFVVGYEVTGPDDTMLVRARTAAAPYDLAQGRLRRLHPGERAAFEAHLAPADPLRQVPAGAVEANAHRYDLVVRWSDLDSYGHVNNVTYFEYLQQARVALLDVIPGAAAQLWSLVRQDLSYLVPIEHQLEPYEVLTSVVAVGNRSLTLAAEIRDPAGARCATASSVVVAGEPLRAEQRTALQRWASP